MLRSVPLTLAEHTQRLQRRGQETFNWSAPEVAREVRCSAPGDAAFPGADAQGR
jgi:hypothetical protein